MPQLCVVLMQARENLFGHSWSELLLRRYAFLGQLDNVIRMYIFLFLRYKFHISFNYASLIPCCFKVLGQGRQVMSSDTQYEHVHCT